MDSENRQSLPIIGENEQIILTHQNIENSSKKKLSSLFMKQVSSTIVDDNGFDD